MQRSRDNLAEWIAQARDGSEEALGECLQACGAYLLLVAREELSDDLVAKAGASDLVQDTFVEAQRDFGQFRGTTEAEFVGWLRTILLNNLANFRRQYCGTEKRNVSREVPIEAHCSSGDLRELLQADMSSPSTQAVMGEQQLAIEEALQRLPDEYRLAICLRNRDGLSFDEIACMIGKSANAARKLWCRAIERLQRELESRP